MPGQAVVLLCDDHHMSTGPLEVHFPNGHNVRHRPAIDSRVCLKRFWRGQGPLKRGQEGATDANTARCPPKRDHSHLPHHVRAPNGRAFWYYLSEIRSCQ